jgi:hypothetical protein
MTYIATVKKTLPLLLAIAAYPGAVHAGAGFKTLANAEAVPLTSSEMERTQGRLAPCVYVGCGGGGFNSLFYGVDIAPSSSSFVLSDIFRSYPHVFGPLFPGLPQGSGGFGGIDRSISSSLGLLSGNFGMIGFNFPSF